MGLRVEHEFTVAMVGSNEHDPAALPEKLANPAKATVHCGAGLDCSGKQAGVSHHVAIGEIEHNQIKGLTRLVCLMQGAQQGVGDLNGTHFRLQIIGGHIPWGVDEYALLLRKGFFLATIEKIGDMGVFFGLRDA